MTKEILTYYKPDAEIPEWEKVGRVHDWRNYIPDSIKLNWFEYTLNARVAMVYIADEAANMEEWD